MKNVKTVFSFALLLVFIVLLSTASALIEVPAGAVSSYSLNTAGETYVLLGDVTADSTAFAFAANNIIFNGNGHTITYAGVSTGNGFTASGRSNITISDVGAIQTNSSVNTSHGVSFTTVTNSTVTNCTFVSAATGHGVYLTSSVNNTFTNSSSSSVGGQGYYAYTGSHNNTFTDCVGNSTIGHGFYIREAQNNILRGCTGVSVNGTGIDLYTNSVNTTVVNSTGRTSIGYGIYATATSNGNINNCTGISVANSGVYFKNATNMSVIGGRTESTDYFALLIDSSNNNTITSHTTVSVGRPAVRVKLSSGNVFTNLVVSSPLASAPQTQKHLLLIGDSITEGTAGGIVPAGAWGLDAAPVLSAQSTWHVSNQGISGETAANGRVRFTQEIDIFRPTDVTIAFGANDIGLSRAEQDTIDDILWMADYAIDNGATPYILLVTPTSTADQNIKRVALNTNLTAQAEALNIAVINAYDAIDSIPQNGAYDAFVPARHVDTQHPNDAGNALIGPYVARNILSTKTPYFGSGLSLTFNANGNITNSRDVVSSDTALDAGFYPNAGYLTVNISEWSETGIGKKVWTESSETAGSTIHMIGGFPANALIQINRDGVKYEDVTSNPAGQITWTYTGGYSEHLFEAFAASEAAIMKTEASGIWSGGVDILIVVIIVMLSMAIVGLLQGKKITPANITELVIGLMIVMLIVTVGYGTLSSMSGFI